jgi:ketosteroid isomerase-like protein
MTRPHDPLVTKFFRAMQAGAPGADELLSLFHDEAEYVEPFSGRELHHRGKPAIRAALEPGWKNPLPEMTITVDRVDVSDDAVRAEWTCRSPALPGGAGRGVNTFDIREGRIAKLVTVLLPPEPDK